MSQRCFLARIIPPAILPIKNVRLSLCGRRSAVQISGNKKARRKPGWEGEREDVKEFGRVIWSAAFAAAPYDQAEGNPAQFLNMEAAPPQRRKAPSPALDLGRQI
jgi:hypothetical protein